jgi:hypothetical protein
MARDPQPAQGQPNDPTLNVGNLIEAEGRFQTAMREAESRFQNAMRDKDARYEESMRMAEARRQNDLATLLRLQVDSLAVNLATQFKEGMGGLSERIAKLEQFRWESGGKTSVSDPAIADALSKMAASIQGLKTTEGRNEGRGAGAKDLWGYIVGGIGILFAASALFLK